MLVELGSIVGRNAVLNCSANSIEVKTPLLPEPVATDIDLLLQNSYSIHTVFVFHWEHLDGNTVTIGVEHEATVIAAHALSVVVLTILALSDGCYTTLVHVFVDISAILVLNNIVLTLFSPRYFLFSSVLASLFSK